jgi:hypothetical protein
MRKTHTPVIKEFSNRMFPYDPVIKKPVDAVGAFTVTSEILTLPLPVMRIKAPFKFASVWSET